MDIKELRHQMEQLWKATFGDSDAYVKLVFNNYFSPENVEYIEEKGELVSMMLAVPYKIEGNGVRLQGEYLCGLATRPDCRKRGLMSQLIRRRNDYAASKGVDLSLLIPSGEGLRAYYKSLGYDDVVRRPISNYTAPHDFERECRLYLAEHADHRVATLKSKYYKTLKGECVKVFDDHLVSELADFCRKCESEYEKLTLRHEIEDFKAAIAENGISGGQIHIVRNNEGVLTACAFVQKGEENNVDVIALYSSDLSSRFKVLDSVKRTNPDSGVCIYVPLDASVDSYIITQNRMMGKILNFEKVLGCVKGMSVEAADKSGLTRRQIQTLLFRKGNSSDTISQTLSIYPLDLSATLMLD